MSFEVDRQVEEETVANKEEQVTRYFSEKNLPKPVPAIKAAPLSGHTNSVSRVIAFDNGSLLATACYDGKVRVYDSSGGTSILRHELPGHAGLVLGLAPICGSIIVSGGWDDKIITWDARSGERIETYKLNDASINTIAPVDSNTFVAGTGGGDLVFFSHVKGKKIKEDERISSAHEAWINHIAIKGDYMVTASFDKTAALWSCTSKKRLATMDHPSNVWCASISTRYIATGAQGEVRVYEIQKDCELRLILKGVHADEFIHAVALAGDEWLLSAGGDGTVTFTSLSSEKPAVRVSTSVPYVLDITLLPNGRVAVCGNESNDTYSSVFASPDKLRAPLSEYTATLFPKRELRNKSNPLDIRKISESDENFAISRKEVDVPDSVEETKEKSTILEEEKAEADEEVEENLQVSKSSEEEKLKVNRDETMNGDSSPMQEKSENHDKSFVNSMVQQWSEMSTQREKKNIRRSVFEKEKSENELLVKENKSSNVPGISDNSLSPSSSSVKSLIEKWSSQ